ncbi:RHS repeat-associated core domain-containing protein [Massilia sp. GCM10023247]|uniref:RHS repeat-associated core domain-containing protein n=1 Tax=Massilia sp. GCM10023247 TaxID=3252643 RepID=UPI003605B28A
MSCAPAGLPGQCVRRRRMVLSRRCAQSTIRGKASQAHRARSCVACRRASPSVRRNPRKPNPSSQVGPLINRQRNSLSRARARAKIAFREKFALYAQSASKNLRQVLERARENRFAYDKRTSGGRFLSIDPVTTDANTGSSFNRYNYAANNPYKYIDPDGRAIETPWDAANVAMGVASLGKNLAVGNYVGAAIDAVGVIADAAATATPGVPGGAATAIGASRAASNLAANAKMGAAFQSNVAADVQRKMWTLLRKLLLRRRVV